jgi:hypothetical protein
MTPQETGLLIGAIIGLIGALQAWLVSRTVQHEKQINGVMSGRITTGANAAIAADHVVNPPPDLKAARIAALKVELAALEPPPGA